MTAIRPPRGAVEYYAHNWQRRTLSWERRRGSAFALLGALIWAASSAGCSDRPVEPEAKKVPGAASAIESHKITWDAPPAWTLTESAEQGPRRAGYSAPRVGNDTEDAEVLVLYFGTNKGSQRDDQWDAWFAQFDGDAKKEAQRSTAETPMGKLETFEHIGNYKLNVGQPRKGVTKSPVQVVKKDFRMVGAVLETREQGRWFFRLVGPDETVKAAKEPFLAMLRSVH